LVSFFGFVLRLRFFVLADRPMIIRRSPLTEQLITQPDHAALAARIMGRWQAGGLQESPRRASILHAIEQHDNGWTEIDERLVVDAASGQLLDFVEVPDAIKRLTSSRGIERLAEDPYAAALVAQHRLHVYRRFASNPEWDPFFAEVTAARDAFLRAAGPAALEQLLEDYTFVRAGDLASLAFCNIWKSVDQEECGYAMHLDGSTLSVIPDPFAGEIVAMRITAREIGRQFLRSAEEARKALASARVLTISGDVRGATA
jgi:hypothetical protein